MVTSLAYAFTLRSGSAARLDADNEAKIEEGERAGDSKDLRAPLASI